MSEKPLGSHDQDDNNKDEREDHYGRDTEEQAPEALDEPRISPPSKAPGILPMPPRIDQECFENNFASKGRVDNKNGCDLVRPRRQPTVAWRCERTDLTDSYSL